MLQQRVLKLQTDTGNGQNTGDAPAGVVTPLAAFDIGYSFAAGKGTTIALGATYNPMKAEFEGKSHSRYSRNNYCQEHLK